MKELLTTKEVAARLGVTVGRVHQFIRAKRLPAQKAGRDYLIAEKDLVLLANRKSGRPKAANGLKQRTKTNSANTRKKTFKKRAKA